jgi:hypothetical protein
MANLSELALSMDPSLLMAAAGLQADPWQQKVLRSKAKRQLLLCSRQAGKSTTTAAMALHTALFEAPALVLLLSPSQRQSQELFRSVMAFYGKLGRPTDPELESSLKMELPNGSRIVALPGKEETVRGYPGVSLLILDEASRIADDLFMSVKPMLAVSNGRMVCLSTPWGKRGFFFEQWSEGQGWERTRVTAEQCPRISAEFLEAERKSLPARWYRQEYECSFEDVAGSVFSYAEIVGAISNDVEPLFELPAEEPGIVDKMLEPIFEVIR